MIRVKKPDKDWQWRLIGLLCALGTLFGAWLSLIEVTPKFIASFLAPFIILGYVFLTTLTAGLLRMGPIWVWNKE